MQTDKPFVQGAVNQHMGDDQGVCPGECCTMSLKRQLELEKGLTAGTRIHASVERSSSVDTPKRNIYIVHTLEYDYVIFFFLVLHFNRCIIFCFIYSEDLLLGM